MEFGSTAVDSEYMDLTADYEVDAETVSLALTCPEQSALTAMEIVLKQDVGLQLADWDSGAIVMDGPGPADFGSLPQDVRVCELVLIPFE
jgi:hypothetical protein